MALQDLLDLSTNRKKIGISEERINAVMPVIRKYTAFWREYPDLFKIEYINPMLERYKYKNLECVQNKQFALTKSNLIRGNKTYILIFTHTGTDGDKFAFQEYEAEMGWIINHTVTLASNTPKQYYIFTIEMSLNCRIKV